MSTEPASILVVDDTPENLRLLVRSLSSVGYQVRGAASGELALEMARAEVPELLLLDVDLPGLDGFETCARLRADPATARVPVLFISAIHDAEVKVKGLRVGARDYVTKPFNMDEVLARVATHVELRRLERALGEANERLEQMVADQVKEISDAQLATIVALAKLAESRDDDTGLHVERIGEMSRVLTVALGRGGDADLELAATISEAAKLHDIGKVGIPDAVLLKPGRLTPDEFAIMQRHSMIGAQTLATVLGSYPRNSLVRLGAEIARSHHEKWDGSGYPDGLAGEAIPLGARVVAVADVYDALRARRPYKEARTHAEATAIIREGSGKHFDPRVVTTFLSVEAEFDAVWASLQAKQQEARAAR